MAIASSNTIRNNNDLILLYHTLCPEEASESREPALDLHLSSAPVFCCLGSGCCSGGGKNDAQGYAIMGLVVAVLALVASFFVALGYTIHSSAEAHAISQQRVPIKKRANELNDNGDLPPVFENAIIVKHFNQADLILKNRHMERAWAASSQALLTVGVALLIAALVYGFVIHMHPWTLGLGIAGVAACLLAPISMGIKYCAMDFEEDRKSEVAIRNYLREQRVQFIRV